MDAISSGDKYNAESMSTDVLGDIYHGSKSRPSRNRREARYKIRDCIKRGQAEWQETLSSTKNTSKGLHRVFKDVVN